MNIAVRYQTRGGNTKAAAEAIAKAANVTAEPIGTPLETPVDILFLGGAVYAFKLDETLTEYINNLEPDAIKTIAAFSTAGFVSGTNKITAAAKARGLTVNEKTLALKVGTRTPAKSPPILTDKQQLKIEDFVKSIC